MNQAVNLTEEQKKELIEKFEEVFKPLMEAVNEFIKILKEWLKEVWINFKAFIEKSLKAKKYISIYNRTRNQRIKKKQVSKILRLFKEKIQC